MKTTNKERARLLRQLLDQQKWIEERGGSRTGYIARYGDPGEATCYGNGGSAIYEADKAALDAYARAVTGIDQKACAKLCAAMRVKP